jgi:aspartokinase
VLKISEIVETIVRADDDALIAFQRGIVNLSGYARSIRAQVESQLFKDVDERSIVVALSRMQHRLVSEHRVPQIRLSAISIHSNLSDIGFEKTKVNIDRIQEVYVAQTNEADKFITITQSVNEVNVIANEELVNQIKKLVNSTPTLYKSGLTGITTKFGREYLDIPNVIYEITRSLAVKNINIIEIISTTSELTFIIDKAEAEIALKQLQKFL